MDKHVSKRALARSLGVSRSSLYYVPKLPVNDKLLHDQIVTALAEHGAYAHRRIALALGIGRKRAHRVMQKCGIQPKILHRMPKYGRSRSESGMLNRTKGILPIAPNVIWVGDVRGRRSLDSRIATFSPIDFSRQSFRRDPSILSTNSSTSYGIEQI